MEAQDEEFESRIRALERLSGGEGRRGTKSFHDQRRGRRDRGRGRGGAGEGARRWVRGSPPSHVHRPIFRQIYTALCFIKTDQKFSDVPLHIGPKRDAPESDRAGYHRLQQNMDQ